MKMRVMREGFTFLFLFTEKSSKKINRYYLNFHFPKLKNCFKLNRIVVCDGAVTIWEWFFVRIGCDTEEYERRLREL